MAKFTIVKSEGCWNLRHNASNTNVAFILEENGVFTVHGFFGQVYGSGATRIDAVKAAIASGRPMGGIPTGAAR